MRGETNRKTLNRLDIFVFAFGAMIGWGWVILSGEWIMKAGAYGAAIAFVVGGVIVYFVGQIYAELTSAMPQNAGILVFCKRAMGQKFAFICTWAILLSYISVIAFEAVALPTVIEYLFPNYLRGYMYEIAGFKIYLSWVAVGVISSLIIAVINLRGVKTAMFLQTVMTLTVFAVGTIFLFGAAKNGSAGNMQPLFNNISGMIGVAIMTPFLYVGFEVIPQAAGEMNVPHRKIGQILVISVIAAVLWYVGIIIGVARTMNISQIANSKLATADAMANAFSGSIFASRLMIVGGIAGIITTWNAFYVACGRTLCVMSEEGMLPKCFSTLHPKFKTPYNAIILVCFITTLAPLFGRNMLVWLANAGGLGVVVCNILVTLSFILLRKKEPGLVRPYTIKKGMFVGYISLLLSIGLAFLYLPGTPAALRWYEWGIVFLWSLLGLYLAVQKNMNPKVSIKVNY